MMAIVARMIRFFGWSHLAVIYAIDNKSDNEDAYDQLLKMIDLFGITITNPEHLRGLPTVLNNSTAALVNATISAIIQSTTRIILILHAYFYNHGANARFRNQRGVCAVICIWTH